MDARSPPRGTYTQLCGGLAYPDGIYQINSSAAYVVSAYTLYVCGGGSAVSIASAPAGYTEDDLGLSGARVGTTLNLLILSPSSVGWVCYGASPSGCASTSGFSLPSAFCASTPSGFCRPAGVVLGAKLTFTYVDSMNAEMVTCLPTHSVAIAGRCVLDAASSALAGHYPLGVARFFGEYYVVDGGCDGDIWVGTQSG
ncbi:MAG: hypothetical protein WCA77_04315, partial [Thermoplasmata archaeon]